MGSIRDNANLKPEQNKAQFCVYCGGKLDEGAHFCKYCGEPVMGIIAEMSDAVDVNELEDSPIQGELSAVQRLSQKLQDIDDEIVIEEATVLDKKGIVKLLKETQLKAKQSKAKKLKDERIIITVSHFVIPNTASDIMEFLTLASDNIQSDGPGKYDSVSKTWIIKATKLYQRAQISIGDKREFNKINNEMIRLKTIITDTGTEKSETKQTR